MSEALIAAAAIKKIQLTADGYRAKYEPQFPFPNQYGGLNLSRFLSIAKDIGFGNEADLIWPYGRVKEEFNKGRLVFIFSGKHLDQNRDDDFSHVSVLKSIDDQNFAVTGWGADLNAEDWGKKRCCGIAFA